MRSSAPASSSLVLFVLASVLTVTAGCGHSGTTAPNPAPAAADAPVASTSEALLTGTNVCYGVTLDGQSTLGGASLPNWTINGNAEVNPGVGSPTDPNGAAGSDMIVTLNTGTQLGSLFYNSPFSTAGNLSIHERVRMSTTGQSADGMAFIMQSSASGVKAIGQAGQGIGYGGSGSASGGISPSVVVEFDTYDNSGDPDANHIAITKGGDPVHTDAVNSGLPIACSSSTSAGSPNCSLSAYSLSSLPAPDGPINLSGGYPIDIWVDYIASSSTINVYVSKTTTKPAKALLTTTSINLASYLGSSFYAGFSGSTGGSEEENEIMAINASNTTTTLNAGEACCLTSADCAVSPGSLYGPVCDTTKHTCGPCSMIASANCPSGTPVCSASNAIDGCTTACTGNNGSATSTTNTNPCPTSTFPYCSPSTSATTPGECVACNGNSGSGATYPCPSGAPTCRNDGFCGLTVANGQACTVGPDCQSGFCSGGTCAAQTCGDGLVQGTEQCDDGNTNNGDGCSSTCTLEGSADSPPFTCTNMPAVYFPNGNFDITASAGGFTCTTTAIADWTIDSGSVNFIAAAGTKSTNCSSAVVAGYYCNGAAPVSGNPAEQACVELSSGAPAMGSMYRDIATVPGHTYRAVLRSAANSSTLLSPGRQAVVYFADPTTNNLYGVRPFYGRQPALTASTAGKYDPENLADFTAFENTTRVRISGLDPNTTSPDGVLIDEVRIIDTTPGASTGYLTTFCTPSLCGDGIVEAGEQCDDGNTSSGDGCSSACLVEVGATCTAGIGNGSVCKFTCGDGIWSPGEGCDDGNTTSGDGCSSTCQVEPGYDCSLASDFTLLTTCAKTSVCGDGKIQAPNEECDDGAKNGTAGDTCDSSCKLIFCGNGVIDAGEACDDGSLNGKAGDPCSSSCLLNAGQPCTAATQCQNGVCGTGGLCGYAAGAGSCTTATAGTVCQSGTCTSGGTTCAGVTLACPLGKICYFMPPMLPQPFESNDTATQVANATATTNWTGDFVVSSGAASASGSYQLGAAAPVAFSTSAATPAAGSFFQYAPLSPTAPSYAGFIPFSGSGANIGYAASVGLFVQSTSPLNVDQRLLNKYWMSSSTALPNTIGLGTRFRLGGFDLNAENNQDGEGGDFVSVYAPTGANVTFTAAPYSYTGSATVAPFWTTLLAYDGGRARNCPGGVSPSSSNCPATTNPLATSLTTTVALTAGQTYLLRTPGQSASGSPAPAAVEIDGALVTADQPIAVMSGGRGWSYPSAANYNQGADSLVPTTALGKEFVVDTYPAGPAGSSQVGYQDVRIVADTNNTLVYLYNNINTYTNPVATLQAGQVYSFSPILSNSGSSNGVTTVVTTQPVYVFQNAGIAGSNGTASAVDFAMVPPVALASSVTSQSLDFNIYDSSSATNPVTAARAVIVLPTSAVSSITVNGTALSGVQATCNGQSPPCKDAVQQHPELTRVRVSLPVTSAEQNISAGSDFQLAIAQAGGTGDSTALFGYYSPYRVPLCGNGVIDPGEQCDDGNVNDLDGCTAACQVQTGYTCTGTPSACKFSCSTDAVCGTGNFCNDSHACQADLANGQAVSTVGHGTCSPETGGTAGPLGTAKSTCTSGYCTPSNYCAPVATNGNTSCDQDSDCSSSQYCNQTTFTCVTKLANGTTIPTDTLHTGTCTAPVPATEITAMCQSGICSKVSNTCAASAGCTADTQCPGNPAVTLLGEWPLNETSGTTAHDTSGNNLSGTISGTANWVPSGGHSGQGALRFDGNTYVDVHFPSTAQAGTGLYMPVGNVSYAMWFQTTNPSVQGLQVVSGGGCDRIIGNGSGNSPQTNIWFNTWSEDNFSEPTNVTDGNWHHMAFVMSEGVGLMGYLDGVLVAGPVATATNCSVAGGVGCSGFNWATDYIIGSGQNCRYNANNFVGSISDVRVYSGALSASQVAQVYSGGFCNGNTGACTAKYASGTALTTDPLHAGTCATSTSTSAVAECGSGTCDTVTDTCASANGASCTNNNQCVVNVCGASGTGTCGAVNGAACTSATAATCASGTCSVSLHCIPAGGCDLDGDCTAAQYCNQTTFACTTKVANGTVIPTDTLHTGTCASPALAAAETGLTQVTAQCQSGLCDSSTNTCAASTGTACTTANQCVENVCVNSKCGYANGTGTCTTGTQTAVCQSGVCSPNGGTCIPSGGCWVDADCTSSQYCNRTTLACVTKITNGTAVAADSLHTGTCASPALATAETGLTQITAECASGTCNATTNTCAGPNTTTACTGSSAAGFCVSNVCGSNSECGYANGQGTCTVANQATTCQSSTCDASGFCIPAAGGCYLDTDCTGATYCNRTTLLCVPKILNGTVIPTDALHTGTCASPALSTAETGLTQITAECSSGLCDATSNTCAAATGTTGCTNANQCVGNVCTTPGASGLCGIPNGSGPCTAANGATVCVSGQCSPSANNGAGLCIANGCASVVPAFTGTVTANPTSCPGAASQYASSCLAIKEGNAAAVSANYCITLPGATSAIIVWCDMTTDGGGYTEYPITNGTSSYSIGTGAQLNGGAISWTAANYTAQTALAPGGSKGNSCPAGMNLAIPRSSAMLSAMQAHFGTSSPAYFATIPGVYGTVYGTNFGSGGDNCLMSSEGAAPCSTDWHAIDQGYWAIETAPYSEPNGDYDPGCWLGTSGLSYAAPGNFNDANCNYTTGTAYICSTNDKGSLACENCGVDTDCMTGYFCNTTTSVCSAKLPNGTAIPNDTIHKGTCNSTTATTVCASGTCNTTTNSCAGPSGITCPATGSTLAGAATCVSDICTAGTCGIPNGSGPCTTATAANCQSLTCAATSGLCIPSGDNCALDTDCTSSQYCNRTAYTCTAKIANGTTIATDSLHTGTCTAPALATAETGLTQITAECASGLCDASANTCAAATGAACTTANQCVVNACTSGKCGAGNGTACTSGATCVNGACSASGFCTGTGGCYLDTDCTATQYCNQTSFACTAKLTNGTTVATDTLHTGTCSAPKLTAIEGSLTQITAECASGLCDATANTCAAANSTSCTATNQCVSNICDTSTGATCTSGATCACGIPTTNPGQPCTSAASCQSGICNASNVCSASNFCTADAQCPSGQYCTAPTSGSTFGCVAQLGNGAAIPNDNLHTGTCSSPSAGQIAAQCTSGLCDATTDTCATTNSASCTAANQCVSNICETSAGAACTAGATCACGTANGAGPCTTANAASVCASGACSPAANGGAGVCIPSCVVPSTTNPSSCLAIKEANPSATSGTYTITVAGAQLSVYCDMTTDGGGYTQYPISSGGIDSYSLPTSGNPNVTAWSGATYSATTALASYNTESALAPGNAKGNSCPAGMNLMIPRTYAMFSAAYSHFGNSYFSAVPGVYGTVAINDTQYVMSSTDPNTSTWHAIDGGPWAIETTTSAGQPDGNYTPGCWLGMGSEWGNAIGSFDDGGCAYHTQGSYVCSVNDKGSTACSTPSCGTDSDCAAGNYCNLSTFSCTPQLANGTAIPKDALHTGTCSAPTPATEVTAICISGKCDATTNTCAAADGVACTAANQCVANVCGSNSECGLANQQSGCLGQPASVCQSGTCNSSGTCIPAGGCYVDADCSSSQYCNRSTLTCASKVGTGGAIPASDGLHTGTCATSTDANAVAECVSGTCNTTTKTCAVANGLACPDGTTSGNAKDCVTNACGSNGECGLANGQTTCTSATKSICQSATCSSNNANCIPAANGCYVDADCTGATYCNRTTFTCAPKIANGGTIPSDGLHTGTCTTANEVVCVTGLCDATANTCGAANGTTGCTAANQCVSNICTAGTCGIPNGTGPCNATNAATNCDSGACSPSANGGAGICIPSGCPSVTATTVNPSSCLAIIEANPSATSGTYTITVQGTPYSVWCDMTSDGGGYTEYAVTGGVPSTGLPTGAGNGASWTAANYVTYTAMAPGAAKGNSCPAGMNIIVPRTVTMFTAMESHFNNTSDFQFVPGVFGTKSNVNYGTGGDNCVLAWNGTSALSTPCQTDWHAIDFGSWAIESAPYSEPNGDYYPGCWLGISSGSEVTPGDFNDGSVSSCPISTGSTYICSTNDKGGACLNGYCGTDSDCTSGDFCNLATFTCTPQLGNGTAIPTDSLHTGTCAKPVPATEVTTICASGLCDPATNTCGGADGVTCTTANQCAQNVCGSNGECGLANGQTGCTSTTSAICQSGVCSTDNSHCIPTAANQGCYVDADCASGNYCNQTKLTCTPKLANGMAIASDTLHQATCASAAAECTSGLCDSATVTCGGSNGTTCTAANQCVVNICSTVGSAKQCGIPNGTGPCTVAAQSNCQSNNCNPSANGGAGLCQAANGCAQDSQCGAGKYCSLSAAQGTCTATLASGQPIPTDLLHNGTCTAPNSAACTSGACNATQNTCASVNGTTCSGGTTTAAAAECVVNYCGSNGQCGLYEGQSGCTPATGAVCQTGTCDASDVCIPTGGCYVDADCSATQFCERSSFTCANKLAAGQSIPNDGLHNATCTTTTGSEVCVSGTCNATRNTCSTANGTACTIAADCTTNNCGSNGLCGLANGQTGCTPATGSLCQSSACDASGYCIPSGGCYLDADCLSTQYCNQTTLACTPKVANGVAIPTDSLHTGTCKAPALSTAEAGLTQITAQCASGLCNSTTNTCAGANTTTACTGASAAAFCASNICGTNGECGYANGQSGCTTGTAATVCQSSTCDSSGSCIPAGGSGCAFDADCPVPTPPAVGTYCNHTTLTCVAKLGNGTSIPNDGLHNGTCTPTQGTEVCASGQCNTSTNTCSGAPGVSCPAGASDCTSNICAANALCGLANNTGTCTVANELTTCQSGLCSASGFCIPAGKNCYADSDCNTATQFCMQSTNTCTTKLANGTAIPADAVHLGTCAAPAPSGEVVSICASGLCNATTNTCAGTNTTTSCSGATAASECVTNQCGSNGKCGLYQGQAGCTSATATVCQSGACSSDGQHCEPNPGCYVDADCASTQYCNQSTFTCTTKLAAGTAIAVDTLHNTASCVWAAAECTTGLCDASASPVTCGAVNGTPCTAANQCVVNICQANSKTGVGNACGESTGGSCSSANPTVCQSSTCSLSNACVPNGGCYNDTDCNTGFFCNRNTNTCTATLGTGQSIPNDGLHNGTCTTANGTAVCTSGQCNTAANTCSTANGTSCTAGPQDCTSNICVQYICGYPNGGGPCTKATAAQVCQSSTCDASGSCVPATNGCYVDADCTGSTYCKRTTFTCAPKIATGQAIPNDGLHNGTCTPTNASEVCVSGACNATTNTCSVANGNTCPDGAQDCTSNVCSPVTVPEAGVVNKCGYAAGQGPCSQANAGVVCQSGFCSVTSNECVAVSGGCTLDADCGSGKYCSNPVGAGSGTCVTELSPGTAMPVDAIHNGTCKPATGVSNATTVCLSGLCDAVTNTCASANGTACTANNQCVVNECDGGKCGFANGDGPCTTPTVCQSGACDPLGKCVPQGGCYVDSDCTSGNYCNQTSYTCTPQLAAGVVIPKDSLHTGTCGAPALSLSETGLTQITAQCQSGVCNAATNTCALTNSSVCSTANQCVTNVCFSGECGYPAGKGPCSSGAGAAVCQSGACSSSTKVCVAANGGCTTDADCATGTQYCAIAVGVASGTCMADLTPGTPVPSDAIHHGTCTTGGAVVCAGGGCDATTNTCASVSGVACTAANQCIANACINGECGYPNGQGACAASASICQSGVCSKSGTCVPSGGCFLDADCSAGTYCDQTTFACTPQLLSGTPIPTDTLHTGTCGSPHPSAEVTAICQSGACNATSNTCAVPNNQPCDDPTYCVTNVCTNGTCGYPNGSGPCTQGAGAAVCQSGVCSAGTKLCVAQGGGCVTDLDCAAGVQYCNIAVGSPSGLCVGDLSAGSAIPTDGIHTGTCASAAAVCLGGACDAVTKTCANLSGVACTAANQCTTNECLTNAQGVAECGYPNGQGQCATSAAICQSGACSPSGVCVPPNGCDTDADCAAGKYCNQTLFQCVPQLANGTAIPTDTLHTGTCGAPSPLAEVTNICVSGACDATTNTCAGQTGTPCTSAAQCANNVCQGGLCGYANGAGSCTSATASVCQSNTCSTSGSCIPVGGCAADSDCWAGQPEATATQFCSKSSLTCKNKLGSGVAIPIDGLHTGTCATATDANAQAVCVSGLCDTAKATCASVNGVACQVAFQCVSNNCGSNGKCGLANGQTGCTPSAGLSDQCALSGTAAACTATSANLCQSGVCDATGTCTPSGGCFLDGDCATGNFCLQSTFTCTPLLANGQAIPSDGLHDGACDAAAVVCASGLCDGSTSTCGGANGVACTANNQCVVNACGNNGECGLANSQTGCTYAGECQSSNCAPVSGVCIGAGAQCGADADCASVATGTYCNGASGQCVSQLVSGTAIPTDGIHDGKCDAAAAVCVTGLCDAATSTCGSATGQPCGANNQCVANACTGGVGALCGYANGLGPCTVANEAVNCQSGVCSPTAGVGGTGLCVPSTAGGCAQDADCQAWEYCAYGTFTCAPKLYPGTAIPNDGLHTGTCASAAAVCLVPLCNTTTNTCAAAVNAPCTTASGCVANACSGNQCGQPNGQGPCTTGVSGNGATVCQGGACSVNATTPVCIPSGGCDVDADCASGKYCNVSTFTCVATLSAGTPVPNDGLHNGTCTNGVSGACVGGVCDTASGNCGLPNGMGCSSAAVCESGVCGTNGQCGLANGQGQCTSATASKVCQSGICDSTGLCIGATVGSCWVDADCATGTFCNRSAQQCVALEADGVAIPNDGLHDGGCDAAPATCVSGLCNATALTCAGAIGQPCNSATGCVGNVCGNNGLCGLAVGQSGCATTGGGSACQSGVCSTAGNKCVPTGTGVCAVDADCTTGFCNAATFTCVPKLASGQPIPNDGVHDGACDAAAAVCVTGLCNAVSDTCASDAGSACTTAAGCVDDVCGTGNKCGYANGSGPCTTATAAGSCQSGFCSAGGDVCIPSATSCYVDSDCTSGNYCNRSTFTCTATLASGTAIPNDGIHDGTCTLATGQQVCKSGACNAEANTCGNVNGQACSAAAECVVNVCASNVCGAPEGAVCSSSAMCLSNSCVSGTCQSTGGAPSLGGGGPSCATGPVGDDLPFGLAAAAAILGLSAAFARRRRSPAARP